MKYGQDIEEIFDELLEGQKSSFMLEGGELFASLVAYFIVGFVYGALLFGAQ